MIKVFAINIVIGYTYFIVFERTHDLVNLHKAEIVSNHLLEHTKTTVDTFLSLSGIICPPPAKTFLMLHTYFSYLRDPSINPVILIDQLYSYQKVIEDEVMMARNLLSPSIGVEIEVSANQFPIENDEDFPSPLTKLFEKVRKDINSFGMDISQDGESIIKTEIRFPPTNSIELQVLLIKEFMDMGLISSSSQDRFIDQYGYEQPFIASMHINLGIPLNGFTYGYYEKLRLQQGFKISLEKTQLAKEYIDAMTMILVCGYTNPGRIEHGVFNAAWRFNNDPKDPTESIKAERIKRIARLELRAFRAMDADSLYQVLLRARGLAEPLCIDDSESIKHMERFISTAVALLNEYNLGTDNLSFSRERSNSLKRMAEVLRTQRHIFFTARRRENLVSQARALANSAIAA